MNKSEAVHLEFSISQLPEIGTVHVVEIGLQYIKVGGRGFKLRL